MNEHLTEKFGRRNAVRDLEAPSSLPIPRMAMQLNHSIRDYARGADNTGDESHWTNYPEVPKATELWDEGRVGHDVPVELEPNLVAGPCDSVEDYLERHYLLLREDAVSSSPYHLPCCFGFDILGHLLLA